MRIKKVVSKSIFLHEETEVKFKTAGNMREVQFSAGVNRKCPIQNISKDEYLDRETGEIKERKKSENRYQSPKSVRKSINKLMDLIRCNATETKHCKWLTLTYADAMTDSEVLIIAYRLVFISKFFNKRNLRLGSHEIKKNKAKK